MSKYLAILFSLLFATSASTAPAQEPAGEPNVMDTPGIVLEVTEESLLIDTATHGQMLVHVSEDTVFEGEEPTVGAYVHVTHYEAMTMSIPPQISALRVGCYAFTGTIGEMDEEFFTLSANGTVYQVNAEAEKLAELSVGQTVTVYSNGIMTMSIPAQVYGELIVAAE